MNEIKEEVCETIVKDNPDLDEDVDDESIKMGECSDDFPDHINEDYVRETSEVYHDPDVAKKIKAMQEAGALMPNILTWRFINNSIDAAKYRSNNE